MLDHVGLFCHLFNDNKKLGLLLVLDLYSVVYIKLSLLLLICKLSVLVSCFRHTNDNRRQTLRDQPGGIYFRSVESLHGYHLHIHLHSYFGRRSMIDLLFCSF